MTFLRTDMMCTIIECAGRDFRRLTMHSAAYGMPTCSPSERMAWYSLRDRKHVHASRALFPATVRMTLPIGPERRRGFGVIDQIGAEALCQHDEVRTRPLTSVDGRRQIR